MTTLVRKFVAIREFSLRLWFATYFERLAVNFFEWAFSKRSVQKAILNHVVCGTPIGSAITRQIEEQAECAANETVENLNIDREIEDAIEMAFRELSADEIDGLDDCVLDTVIKADKYWIKEFANELFPILQELRVEAEEEAAFEAAHISEAWMTAEEAVTTPQPE